MSRSDWKGHKKEHEWWYMGWDTERKVEYAYCDMCKKYRIMGGRFITKKEYLDRMNKGFIIGMM